jgi:hypothetical protein
VFGSDRLYMAYANKKECTVDYCTVVDSIPVKLIVNYNTVSSYYGVTINGVLGVKTAYCVNDDRANDCPSWVNGALRDSFRSAPGVTQVSTERSYEPLPLG